MKLAQVMGLVERVAKNGKNELQGYRYVTEADVLECVRGALAERHVMLIPHIEATAWAELPTKSGGTQRLCTVNIRFDFMDGESGDVLSVPMVGQGMDAGDKALYKALTGAEKYVVLKTFLVSTGDDPENEKAQKTPPAPPGGLQALKDKIVQGQASNAAHPELVMGNFGKRAGAKLSEISDDDVTFYRSACKRTIADAAKAQFHEKERQRLAIFDAALRARGLPVD